MQHYKNNSILLKPLTGKILNIIIRKLKNKQMKKVLLISFLIPILTLGKIIGQQNPSYELTGFIQSDKVNLRWAPKDYNSWKAGNQYGYKLTRYTLKLDGNKLNSEDQLLSELIILDDKKPLPEAAWESKAETNRFAGIAAGAIYGDTFEIEDIANNPTVRAINQMQEKDTRYSFSLMAADMDFEVAKDMALGYLDEDAIKTGSRYLYILTLGSGMDSIVINKGIFMADIDSVSSLKAIDQIQGTGGDKQASLEWSLPLDRNFTAYNLEKSTDGGATFVTVNQLPIVGIQSGDNNRIRVTDSLTNNTSDNIYRVRGINEFGVEGPPSDTVHVKGKASRELFYPYITSTLHLANQGLQITWEYRNISDIQKIKHVNVYKASSHNTEHLIKLNQNPLPVSQLSYIDPNPAASNYYVIKITDYANYEYSSISTLGQLQDSIPPAAPVQLVGQIDNFGNVQLSWKKNTETDMNAYRLFMSGFRDSLYVQVSSDLILDSFYYYYVDLETLTKKIYFKITAEDMHHNQSPMSAVCEITRPDKIAPSKPVFFEYKPTSQGILLSFITSSSDDVASHKLLRRNKGSRLWSTLYTIQGVQTGQQYAFVDSTVAKKVIYEYRVLAYDLSGNYSSSKIVEAVPFDNGIRGAIVNFSLTHVPYSPGTVTGQANQSSSPNPYPSEVNILQWNYYNMDELDRFEIYRSVDSVTYRLVDVVYLTKQTIHYDPALLAYIGPKKFFYIDLNLLKRKALSGTNGNPSGNGGTGTPGGNGGGNNPGGNNSSYSPRTYTYKVVAHHLDGGTSTFSNSLQVTIN